MQLRSDPGYGRPHSIHSVRPESIRSQRPQSIRSLRPPSAEHLQSAQVEHPQPVQSPSIQPQSVRPHSRQSIRSAATAPETTTLSDITKSPFESKGVSLHSVKSSFTVGSAAATRRIRFSGKKASRLSSLRAVLRGRLRSTKPTTEVVKKTVLRMVQFDSAHRMNRGLLIQEDSNVIYYAHLSNPGRVHMKSKGVYFDFHFHAGGARGPVVGAVNIACHEFCLDDPGKIDAAWMETHRWWPGYHTDVEERTLYGFPIYPDPFGADSPEKQTPDKRFKATNEKYSTLSGRWKCADTDGKWWEEEIFFYPGWKTLIWKWTSWRSYEFTWKDGSVATAQRVGLLVDLENKVFAVFEGDWDGVIKWYQRLSLEQEKAALLVLCHRLHTKQHDTDMFAKKVVK